MADFGKRAPGTEGKGPGDLFGDDVADIAMQVTSHIWPLMIGGLILFLMIVKGWERAAIPVGICVAAAQLWLMYG